MSSAREGAVDYAEYALKKKSKLTSRGMVGNLPITSWNSHAVLLCDATEDFQ